MCKACELRGYSFCHRPKWHADLASGINQVEDALGNAIKVIGLVIAEIHRVDRIKPPHPDASLTIAWECVDKIRDIVNA